jgi:ankyrin repeat protein
MKIAVYKNKVFQLTKIHRQNKITRQYKQNKNLYIQQIFYSECEKGNLQLVKYLVSLKANITADDNYVVKIASRNGHLEVVKYLVSLKANITADDNYAVNWASGNDYLQVVKYLVSLGANIITNDKRIIRLTNQHGHLQENKYIESKNVTQEGKRFNFSLTIKEKIKKF